MSKAPGDRADAGVGRMKIEHILVPTDYSGHAVRALEWALLEARGSGARITVLHVLDHGPHLALHGYATRPSEVDQAAAAEALGDLVRTHAAQACVETNSVIGVGDPAHEIRATAARLGADLIVMGSRGRTGLREIFFGSVASTVVHHTGPPVVVVPPPTEAVLA